MSTSDERNDESATEQRLSGALAVLADWTQPPSGVSIEAVVGAGRRGMRRRRRVAALGAALVFAASAVGVWGAVDHLPARTTASAGPDLWGHALRGKDPMVPLASFGWLPGPSTGGFTWTLTKGGDFDIADENGTVNVSLTLQAVGKPEPGGTHTPAGTVDGQPAEWMSGMSDPELLWQYEPGAWAVLLVEGATQDQATRVADSLRFGSQDPVAMPFQLPALPKGFTVGGASAMRNTQNKTAMGNGSLTLCAKAGGCSTKNGQPQDILSLSASSPVQFNQSEGSGTVTGLGGSTSAGVPTNSSTVKVHGVTVQYIANSDGSIGLNFSINGLNVQVAVNGAAVKAIGGRDGLSRFLDSVTWYGTNPSGWTTDVIG